MSVLRDVVREHFRWEEWEALVRERGCEIDRPYRSTHPTIPRIVYPLDYGYVPGTLGTDGDGIDVFVGSAGNGLVGVIVTHDHVRGDREFKLLYDCTPEEVYLANGFINFDRTLLEGVLVLRRPMHEMWDLGAAPPRTP